jgi:two-component system, chemotaxis family, protein-glutamate methylesterase/glutaminase
MAEKGVNNFKVVAIGGSAGSLDVLFNMLPLLRQTLPVAIVIVLHRKSSGDSMLVDLFSLKTSLPVKEVEEKDTVLPGNIYLAPADYHLLFERDETFSLDYSEKVNYSRPSIDTCFESAAEVFGPRLVGILLSGANADGVEGLIAIKKNGGYTIAQSPESAEVPYMPSKAIQSSDIDEVINPEGLAAFINALAK